jgi:hypothetical protein
MKTAVLALSLCLAAAACGRTTAPSGAGSGSDNPARGADAPYRTPSERAFETDLQRSDDVRRRISDLGLATKLDDVKVSTVDGRVMLRGFAKSQADRDRIVQCARDVAGAAVDDRIEVESIR